MKIRYITTLLGAGAAAFAIAAAPMASAADTVVQTPGNAQITASPGGAAQEAAQNQQPFGGYEGALLFHHGFGGGHR
jgi:hypothetical protein